MRTGFSFSLSLLFSLFECDFSGYHFCIRVGGDDFDLPGGVFHLELIGRKAAVAGIDINMQRGETHAGPTGRIFLLRLLCQDGDFQTNAGKNDWRYFAHYKTPLSRRTAARATTSTSLRSIRPSPLMSHSVSAGPADS